MKTEADKVKSIFPDAKVKMRTISRKGKRISMYYIEINGGAVLAKGKSSLEAWKRAVNVL